MFGQQNRLRFRIIGTDSVVGFYGQILSRTNSLPSPTLMSLHTALADPTPIRPLPIRRSWWVVMLLLVAVVGGCSRLRLPAIDSTGACLFSPLPTTTSLVHPHASGRLCICSRCISGLKGCLHKSKSGAGFKPQFRIPKPVFTQPATPPPCPTPQSAAPPSTEACVPSVPCNGSCKDGPPAVVFGDKRTLTEKLHLANKGKRGCILLSPQKVVAPVGGEVVLLSGICGNDGYLQMNERLEWMLTPESVGTFIQIGDDKPGLLSRLVGASKRPAKRDGSYANGVTSRKRTLITRGNNDSSDDVQLEKGQTWITISSPTEGTSRVTVLAPDSDCWDQRKATTTIYWIDARWQFPGPQIVQAGQEVELTTRVTRAEGSIAARGWKVRYEIQQGEMARFSGVNGSSVVEAVVDESGNATVRLVPTPGTAGTAGTATVTMQVIRPAGETSNMPAMTLGRGQTYVTWSSPKLVLQAGAPQVATFDVPFEVVAKLSNPGDQTATNVRVDVPIPAGARVTNADGFATVTPGAVIWEIGELPPRTQIDLFMSVATKAPLQLPFQATADGLRAEDTVRIDVFRPSLVLTVTPARDRYEAGQPVTFNIDVINSGDRPMQNVSLTVTGDAGMIHGNGSRTQVNDRTDPLQPGETWAATVTMVSTQVGRRCVTIQCTAANGQLASQESCVTVINPVPPAQSLTATLSGRDRLVVGQTPLPLFRARIVNTGDVAMQAVRVTMVNDPQLQIVEATGDRLTQARGNLIIWTIPTLAPNESVVLEGRYRAVAASVSVRVALSAESANGTASDTDFLCEIVDAAAAAAPTLSPALPPAQSAPQIPGGVGPPVAPLQGAPAPLGPPPLPARSGRIQIRLFGHNNPVAVNDLIHYSLNVTNDSDERDGQILIQFPLPAGVTIVRVNQLTNPELGQFQNNAGVISLALIRSMNPGESVDYKIVLQSNQPQTFDLNIQLRSRAMSDAISATVQTEVR